MRAGDLVKDRNPEEPALHSFRWSGPRRRYTLLAVERRACAAAAAQRHYVMSRWKHLRWWKTAPEKAAEFAAARSPQADHEFFAGCGIPDTEDARNVALTVRRAVAEMLTLDPHFFHASDREVVELRALWDSVDFLEWVMKTEKALNVRLPDKAFKALRRDYTIRDLVLCVYSDRARVT